MTTLDIPSHAHGHLKRGEYDLSDGNLFQPRNGQDRAPFIGQWQGHAHDIPSRAQGHLKRGEYGPSDGN